MNIDNIVNQTAAIGSWRSKVLTETGSKNMQIRGGGRVGKCKIRLASLDNYLLTKHNSAAGRCTILLLCHWRFEPLFLAVNCPKYTRFKWGQYIINHLFNIANLDVKFGVYEDHIYSYNRSFGTVCTMFMCRNKKYANYECQEKAKYGYQQWNILGRDGPKTTFVCLYMTNISLQLFSL